MILREQLLTVANIYCEQMGISRARLSTLVLSGGQRLDRIERGSDIATATFERTMLWFSKNWPETAVWPEEVPRPVFDISEAAE